MHATQAHSAYLEQFGQPWLVFSYRSHRLEAAARSRKGVSEWAAREHWVSHGQAARVEWLSYELGISRTQGVVPMKGVKVRVTYSPIIHSAAD